MKSLLDRLDRNKASAFHTEDGSARGASLVEIAIVLVFVAVMVAATLHFMVRLEDTDLQDRFDIAFQSAPNPRVNIINKEGEEVAAQRNAVYRPACWSMRNYMRFVLAEDPSPSVDGGAAVGEYGSYNSSNDEWSCRSSASASDVYWQYTCGYWTGCDIDQFKAPAARVMNLVGCGRAFGLMVNPHKPCDTDERQFAVKVGILEAGSAPSGPWYEVTPLSTPPIPDITY